MEKNMKVSDIITEEFDGCISRNVKEIFDREYEDITGVISMDFDEILGLMREATTKQNDINFQKEEAFLNKLLQIDEVIYISKNDKLAERLDQLHDTMNSEGNIMTIVTAIQEFIRLLSKHTTTESEWENSDEGEAAMQQAEETCNEPSDPYKRIGMKPSDYF